MTAFNKTVTNSMAVFGCPANNWNAFAWNAFKWGSGTADLPVQVRHLVTNTLSPTEDSIGHAVRHLVTNALVPTEDSIGHAVRHLVTNSLVPTEDSIGHAVRHLVTNTLTPTEDSVGHSVYHLVSNTLTLVATDAENIIKDILNEIVATSDVTAIYVQDSNGWFRVFPGDTSNGNDLVHPTWAAVTATTATWVVVSDQSTTWSN